MKFTGIVVSAAMAACVQALAAFTNSAYRVEAGKPFTLNWSSQDSPTVDIVLKNGNKDFLNTVEVLATSVTGTTFTWTPPATLPSDLYAFEIRDGGKLNWSPQWQFAGSTPASSSTPPRSTTSGVVSSSSTTSAPASTTSGSTSRNSSASSTSSTSQTQTSTSARPSATGGGSTNLNSGVKYQSSPLAFILVVVATLFYIN